MKAIRYLLDTYQDVSKHHNLKVAGVSTFLPSVGGVMRVVSSLTCSHQG